MAVGTEPRIEQSRTVQRPKTSGSWFSKLLGVLLVVGVLVGGGYGISRLLSLSDESEDSVVSTYVVEPTELLITVTEDGNVESALNIDVKCQVAGGSSILWIVPDGTEVKKGDKIVELDAAAIEDGINTQRIAVSKARSAMVQAEKNFEVAQIAVREYLEGTFVKELEDAETQITIAEENLRSAKNSLDYSERMFQRGYISELELESQQFAVKRAQLELNSANTVKKVLEEFTKVKTLEDLKSQVETARAARESEEAAYELEDTKLKRLEAQLAACTILAPQSGMVVFANERGGRFGQQQSGIEEGAAVRDRQTILRLPDLAQMQVKVNVHETKVESLERGMRARIGIQGRELLGTVTSIGNQPEATSFFQGNVKEYATTVRIEGEPDGLKPGMTAEVEILIAHLTDIISIPVSAVVEQRGKFYCWVKNQTEPERRELLLGLSNDQFVEVKDGLAMGDAVIRNPRAVVTEANQGDVQEEEQPDVNEKFGAERASSADGGNGPGGEGMRGPGGPGMGNGPGGDATRGPRGGGGEGPAFGGPGRGGPGNGGPGGGGPGNGGPGGGGRGPSFDLMQFDSDGDGRVSKDEAPERMQNFFDRMDPNGDGFIDQAEVDEMRSRFGGGRGGPGRGGPEGGGPGSGGPGGPGGPGSGGPPRE
ncbi:MAG: HlyD family efflux transporter periplasmic adaptor subunit [Planctomycetales bacterium]|nr:HlyD family efflux transporter periplasmic adaptor subunit [Planctomycetales bacterium]